MFGSVILDVAIGLVLVFLLLSLIASAVREAIESVVKARAVHLERGIRALLDDPQGTGFAKQLYMHPLVSGLFQGDFLAKTTRRMGTNLPTYIPTRTFVQAVLDLVVRPPVPEPYAGLQTESVVTIDTLRAAIGRIESPAVRRALRSAVDAAQGDIERARNNIAAWFDSGMERVSGAYKRRTHWGLLAIGITLAVIIDVDTVRIGQHLYRTPSSRAAALAIASSVRADTIRAPGDTIALRVAREALARLDSIGLPILWRGVRPAPGAILAHMSNSVLGWIVTALAVSLGAPFWFDLLNKFMVIRSTVKPREKSPEESSKDRQKPLAGEGPALAEPTATTPEHVAIAPKPVFTPREWADGEEDGIL
jgi:hypothetical protein